MLILPRKNIKYNISIQFIKQYMSFIDRDIMNTANLVINEILEIMKIGERMEKIQKTKN